MKRILSIFLALALLTPLVSSGVNAETNTNSESTSLEAINAVLLDSPTATKTVTFSFPKEAENIVKGSFKISGQGEIVGEPVVNLKTKEITITFKGKEKVVTPTEVKGYKDGDGKKFISNPGNAMCRYSDGIDWQIATERTSDFSQAPLQRYSNTSTSAPTNVPYSQLRQVVAHVNPTLSVNGSYWFDDKGKSYATNQIDASQLKLPKSAVSAVQVKVDLGGGKIDYSKGSAVFPNDYDPTKPRIGTQYKPTYKEFKSWDKIDTKNPAFLTGHAACYMYPTQIEYYVTAMTKPGKAYDLSGTISFQYTKPTNAYIVATLTADPTSTKFDDKDVKVKLTLDGEVKNLSNPGAIDYYMLYIRTDDSSINPPGIEIKANGKLKVSASLDFTIPKSKMTNKNEFTEIYVGRIFAYYKASSYFVDPVNETFMDSGQAKATSLVYKELTPPPPPPPQRHAPTAVIVSDSEVLLGDDVYVNGYDSHDSDGTIETYRWTMSGANDPIIKNEGDGWIWYDKLGPKTVNLCVIDNDSLLDCTKHSLIVTEPIVKADIRQTGTFKENRKVTFTATGTTSSRYPIVDSKTTWKIESAYGEIPQSQIKTSSPLKGNKSIDVLFKTPGEYKVTLYMENTLGYNDEITRVYNILPDEVPYTNFTFQEKIYRDPVKGNLATFEFTDRSYSTDGDQIAKRNWYVIFDANNDGIYNESKVLFQSGNENNVIYESKHVGKYRFFLEVQEEFGQPTIDAFVTASDRRKSNTWE